MYENEALLLIENRADPHIYKHSDGYYYFTATVPSYDSIILRRSKTLKGLSTAEEHIIWRKHNEGEMSHFIWAPEIHFIEGSWYIYFAAKDNDSLNHTHSAHKMYVLQCMEDNPTIGKWVELGQLKTNWASFSLDATTFKHLGIRYLVWAQMDESIDSNSNIYIAKMKSPYEIEGQQILLTKPELPWEIIGYKVNEGPSVLIQEGKVILSFSASATDANYTIGVLIADAKSNLLDRQSWQKHNSPIRKSDEEIKEFGPGHNCFTYAEDDKTTLMVYHARNYKDINGDPLHDENRHTKVVEFRLENVLPVL